MLGLIHYCINNHRKENNLATIPNPGSYISMEQFKPEW